jgi:hypothetical protein
MPKKETFKPEPPKKPMCAFFLYRMDIYPKIKDQYSGYRITEITREIGDMWKAEKPEIKEMYEVRAAKEKERVRREREQYEAMYGKPESKRKRKRKLKRDVEQLKRYLNSRDHIDAS